MHIAEVISVATIGFTSRVVYPRTSFMFGHLPQTPSPNSTYPFCRCCCCYWFRSHFGSSPSGLEHLPLLFDSNPVLGQFSIPSGSMAWSAQNAAALMKQLHSMMQAQGGKRAQIVNGGALQDLSQSGTTVWDWQSPRRANLAQIVRFEVPARQPSNGVLTSWTSQSTRRESTDWRQGRQGERHCSCHRHRQASPNQQRARPGRGGA
eukprot:4920257-Amphidinium_carterae.1